MNVLGSTSPEAYKTLRWYSTWSLILSLLVVGCFLLVWIPLTLSGRLHDRASDDQPHDELDIANSNELNEPINPLHLMWNEQQQIHGSSDYMNVIERGATLGRGLALQSSIDT